jgi:hypothetical protein
MRAREYQNQLMFRSVAMASDVMQSGHLIERIATLKNKPRGEGIWSARKDFSFGEYCSLLQAHPRESWRC